jgi:hypothetical protein
MIDDQFVLEELIIRKIQDMKPDEMGGLIFSLKM